ncbi:MAG: DNA cytosine methyltransferase [Candidatus Nanohaloarchaea archaeon]
MNEELKAIDLFAGAGGLSRGIEEAGFDVIWAIDHEENCKPTFEANHDAELEVADITETTPPDLGLEEGELDLIVGGPPCPTFSMVGRSKINSIEGRNNKEDDRHQLYQDFLRFVDHFRPKAFVMENVEGMTSAENKDGEPVVEVIKEEMRELGYEVKAKVLDAANFGVPQHRKRIVFIGNRIGKENPDMEDWRTHRKPMNEEEKKMKFYRDEGPEDDNQQTIGGFSEEDDEFPTFEKNRQREPWNTVGDAILELPPVSPDGNTPPTECKEYTIPAISEYQHWARDLDGEDWEEAELDSHVCRGHNMRDLTIYKFLCESSSHIIGDLPDDINPYRTDIFQDKIKSQDPKKPSSTVVAHLYKDGHMFAHPTEARSITVREAARLQSFKDSFTFPVARTHAFKQIGNAVPPLLGQAIGTAVREEIFGIENEEKADKISQ